MAILNFMPQFVPWSTKVLLKKKDDPDVAAATESTTGFFGDTFDFIDDAFDWTATAVEEPAIQYEEPPQYFDAPVAPPESFYDVPPQYYDAPVQDTGFGSAIGDIFNGSGEGLGFDFIGEPTDSWTSQAPFEVPQADYNWDGGMGFDPVPQPTAPTYGFGEGIGDQFSNYFNWNSEVAPTPTPYTPAPDLGSMDIQPTEPPLLPQGEQQPWMNLDFPDFGNTLTDWANPAPRYEDAVPMENPSAISSGLMDLPASDPMGWNDISSMFNAARPEPTPAPQTWDIPGMENPNTAIPGWFSMSPDERGEYVWQSGLPAESYLTDEDIAGMSREVRFKLNFAENERGNKSNWEWIKDSIIRPLDVANSNVFEPIGDAVVDPLLDPLTSTGNIISPLQPGFFSDGMSVDINLRGDTDNVDFDYPLDDTIANARAADNPWDFMEMQDENFKDRPMLQQIALQMLGPGNGLWKNIDALPGWLKTADNVADIAQGGFISDIPGAGGFVKNVALPFGIGAVGGAATEVAFDPKYTYTDEITGETKTIDPNMWQMATGFGTGTVLGKNALGRGLLPGNSIDNVGGAADDLIAQQVADQARRASIPVRVANELDDSAIDFLERLPRISDGGTSNGRFVREEIPNLDSISSSLNEYHSVGVRDIPMSEFDNGGGYVSASDRQRVRDLADAIQESGEVSPLIVVMDKDGLYVLEGAHRFDALREIGAESFPAFVVVDMDEATGLGFKGAAGSVQPLDIPTVPSAITETPQERLVRLQQEVFASDPTAAAPFSAPGAVSPSVADEIPTVPAAGRAEDLGNLGGIAGGISDNMYAMLWKKVEAGDITENGQPSALLQAAKMVRDAGGMEDVSTLRKLANDMGANVKRGTPEFQSQMQELVRRYIPVADGISTVPTTAADSELLPGVRGIAQTMDDQSLPAIAGTTTYGLPNKKRVKLQWEDDIDKALYLASSGSNTNAANDAFRLLDSRGFTRADINEAGYMLRRHIDEATQGLFGGETIVVPKIVRANAGMADEISTVPAALSRTATPEIPTVPTGIADEVATPAPSTPLVDRALNHISEILDDRAVNAERRASEFRKWQQGVSDAAEANHPDDPVAALQETGRRLSGITEDTFAPDVTPLTFEEGEALKKLAITKAKGMGYGMPYAGFNIRDAVDSLVKGTNANPVELKVLRNVLTDTPYQKAADDAIETMAPKADGIVRRPNARIVDDTVEPGMEKPIGETIDEIGTAKLAPEDEAIIGADDALFPEFKPSGIERTSINDRGSFQTSLGSVDETAQYRSPGAPVIGEDDPLQRRLPLWGEADKAARPDEYPFSNPRPDVQARTPNEAVKAVDAWQADVVERGKGMQPDALNRFLDEELAKFIDENGSEVAPMAKLARAQVPSRIQKQALGEWQAPFSQAMPSGVPTDIPTESGALVSKRAAEMADVAPSNIDSVPAVIRPIVEEWEQKALNAVKGLPMTKRADELDKMQLELSRSLRGQVPDGTAVSQAERSRDRVVYALNRQNKATVDEGLADWRRLNEPELNDIKMFANTSWGERWVGGALKSKLADAMTARGRDLDQWLQRQGYTFEESKAIVDNELSRYLDARTLREANGGNRNAINEHMLTALHMGDFRPTIDGIEVPKGTGDVANWIEVGRTANSALKNLFFGVADVGALMANAIPAVQAQGIPITIAYLNRLTKLVDIDDSKKFREFSGLATGSSQDVIDEKVGTLIGVGGRMLEGAGANKLGNALVKIDQGPVAWNRLLEKVQFDLMLDKTLRQPAYEGNMILLKLLGQDITDPKTQRAAARMANAATSTAPLARGSTRRGIEGASLGSARFLRAQADLILAASKLINPRASAQERIVAATAIMSLGGTFFLARAIAGDKMSIDPEKPYEFGQILLPGGMIMPSLQQRQLAMAFNKSGQELAKVIKGGDGDISAVTDPWVQFAISRTGPLGGYGQKLIGIGYDPKEQKYSYPGEGRTPWGSNMSFKERIDAALPKPAGIDQWRNSDVSTWAKTVNVAGAGIRPDGDVTSALRKYGVTTMEEFKALDPITYINRREKLYQENPKLREKFADSAVSQYQEEKAINSTKFMDNALTIGQWKAEKDRIAAGTGGAYNELGLEEKERPTEDGSDQWLWDYNQTFANAREDPERATSPIDYEKLGDLQAKFWADHTDPKVRKEILEYQQLKAPTEADKAYARSMARLNGFDPDTGEQLTFPSGKPYPNLFQMDRYLWTEVPNDESREFFYGFNSWKIDQIRDDPDFSKLKKDAQIRLYTRDPEGQNVRSTGEKWTATAIQDLVNYRSPTKENPKWASHKDRMASDWLWIDDDAKWSNIEKAQGRKE